MAQQHGDEGLSYRCRWWWWWAAAPAAVARGGPRPKGRARPSQTAHGCTNARGQPGAWARRRALVPTAAAVASQGTDGGATQKPWRKLRLKSPSSKALARKNGGRGKEKMNEEEMKQ